MSDGHVRMCLKIVPAAEPNAVGEHVTVDVPKDQSSGKAIFDYSPRAGWFTVSYERVECQADALDRAKYGPRLTA